MRVRVIKSQMRKYGYTLQVVGEVPSWVIGPNGTFAWYKYKRDAVSRAAVYNKDVAKEEAA